MWNKGYIDPESWKLASKVNLNRRAGIDKERRSLPGSRCFFPPYLQTAFQDTNGWSFHSCKRTSECTECQSTPHPGCRIANAHVLFPVLKPCVLFSLSAAIVLFPIISQLACMAKTWQDDSAHKRRLERPNMYNNRRSLCQCLSYSSTYIQNISKSRFHIQQEGEHRQTPQKH